MIKKLLYLELLSASDYKTQLSVCTDSDPTILREGTTLYSVASSPLAMCLRSLVDGRLQTATHVCLSGPRTVLPSDVSIDGGYGPPNKLLVPGLPSRILSLVFNANITPSPLPSIHTPHVLSTLGLQSHSSEIQSLTPMACLAPASYFFRRRQPTRKRHV